MPRSAISDPAVLITGAAKRIGATLAQRFAKLGWHVVIHAGHSPKAAQILAADRPDADVVHCDLRDGDAALAMIDDLAARLDDWRMLINCAAVFRYDDGAAIDPAIYAEASKVNAETPARMAQRFLTKARTNDSFGQRKGRRVINFLDQKLLNPNPDFFSYTMAKHALAAATRMQAMAQPRAEDRIYGLAPGAMLPSFDQQPEEHELSGRMNLLQRLTDPEELADAALFLSQGWLASGETLFIDSGQHLLAQPRDVLYLARE